MTIELFQHVGTKKVLMPFGVKGELCQFFKSDDYVMPDIKQAFNVTSCPLEPVSYFNKDYAPELKEISRTYSLCEDRCCPPFCRHFPCEILWSELV